MCGFNKFLLKWWPHSRRWINKRSSFLLAFLFAIAFFWGCTQKTISLLLDQINWSLQVQNTHQVANWVIEMWGGLAVQLFFLPLKNTRRRCDDGLFSKFNCSIGEGAEEFNCSLIQRRRKFYDMLIEGWSLWPVNETTRGIFYLHSRRWWWWMNNQTRSTRRVIFYERISLLPITSSLLSCLVGNLKSALKCIYRSVLLPHVSCSNFQILPLPAVICTAHFVATVAGGLVGWLDRPPLA